MQVGRWVFIGAISWAPVGAMWEATGLQRFHAGGHPLPLADGIYIAIAATGAGLLGCMAGGLFALVRAHWVAWLSRRASGVLLVSDERVDEQAWPPAPRQP